MPRFMTEHARRTSVTPRQVTVVSPVKEEDSSPGSDDWWSDWLETWGPRLRLYARQFTRSEADADEVLQQAVIRFWKSGRFMQKDPRGYIFSCVRSAAIDHHRSNSRRRHREQVVGNQKPVSAWFEDRIEGDERRRRIELALKELNPDQREVLVMKIWGELTFSQIAGVLEISANTVASRYRYALQALQRLLDREELHD